MASTHKPLRAVKLNATPDPKVRRLSITEAAAAGKDRELLVALPARVAATVEDPNCPPRDLAALTRRLQEITKDIAAIDARSEEEGNPGAATPDASWEAI